MRRQRNPLPLDNGDASGSCPRRSVQSRRVDGDTTDHSVSVSRLPRRRRYTRKRVRESSFNSSSGHASSPTSTREENDSVETMLKNHIKKVIEASGSRIIDQLERWFEELKDLINSGTLHRSPSVRQRRDTRKRVIESSSSCSSGHASGPTSTQEENDSVETMKNDIEKLIKASESRILDQVGRWFEELKDQINSGTLHRYLRFTNRPRLVVLESCLLAVAVGTRPVRPAR